MGEEMVLTVLNEVLGELQTANKSLKEMGGTIKTLEARVQAFEQKEIRIDPPDLEPLKEKIDALPGVINLEMMQVDEYMRQQIVTQGAELRKETTAGLSKIAAVVETQPKPIVRRISLFPENDYQGNYKTFIRWLIGGIVGALMVFSAYVLINEWILHSAPQEMPAAVSGMSPIAPPPAAVLAPTRKAGEGGFRKKSKKKIDTLKQNVIRQFVDSLGPN